ncbi:MAG TPA: methionyl-tRNA formyltransferase [Gemmatimonadales bacterium]
MRIVFFGTPEFAVPSLRALLDEGADVVAVVTQPDRPQGRSRSTIVPPPVKTLAEERGLAVMQPERPRGDVFLANLRRVAPEVGVVVAYGHILRPEVLAVPARGMINVHASLLPRHRGAAPIQAAILAGDLETGVTVMRMDPGMDTGPILHQARTLIRPDETGGQLASRLAELGGRALTEALVLLQQGVLRPEPQDETRATYAPKLDRDQARISWNDPGEEVVRRIRAFDPTPGAWTTLDGGELKLFGGRLAGAGAGRARGGEGGGGGAGGSEPGTILGVASELVVATGAGDVAIADVQPAGRRRMTAAEWFRGREGTGTGAAVGWRFQ